MNVTHLTIALVTAAACVAPLAAQDTTTAAPEAMAPPAAAATSATVEAVLARDVMDRMPIDSATAFAPDVGTVVLWMRVSGAEGHTLSHVWFHGDTEVANIPLNIGGSPWRTWSRKTVPADWTGAWHVEVRDAAGTLLKRIDFTVGG
jgi:hypothetical protein